MEEANDLSLYNEINERSHNATDEDYDDDDDERGDTTTTAVTNPDGRRDEVGEVRKMSSKDTNRLQLWRIVVTGVLLLTAFAVTFTTYTLLKQQEDENFQTAVRRFPVDSNIYIYIYKYIYIYININIYSISNRCTLYSTRVPLTVCTIRTYGG